jgi:hypothetical protein
MSIFQMPTTMTMEIWITDGKNIGKVVYELPAGRCPTQDVVKEIIEKVKRRFPEGYRICDHHEFAKALLFEKTGQRLGVSGENKWASTP